MFRRLITAPTSSKGFSCGSKIMHHTVGANIIRLNSGSCPLNEPDTREGRPYTGAER